jgi:hypothetical protein
VLDLFSGLGGWSAPFKDAGHDVITLDLDGRFHPTICEDALRLAPKDFYNFDAIFASPPCEAFSVAALGHHWQLGYEPATEHAHTSLALVHWTLAVIEAAQPAVWVVENPRGMLRKLGLMDRYERVTVTYCQYGDTSMKPTDLWGGFPKDWAPRPMCRNGASCHEAAPRGARTGTQGKDGAANRAEIPYELASSFLDAMLEVVPQ